MRIRIVLLSSALFATVPIAAWADSGPMENAGRAVDDTWINTHVQSQFVADELIAKDHIGVQTKGGVVTLSGAVQSQEAHDRAVSIAQHTKGVQGVDDDITVK